MSSNDVAVFKYVQLTASAPIPNAYFLGGIFCSTAPTSIKIWDNSSAAGAVLIDTFTPTVGFFSMPAVTISKNLFITIVGAGSITVFYN